jgi:hypothetical protein
MAVANGVSNYFRHLMVQETSLLTWNAALRISHHLLICPFEFLHWNWRFLEDNTVNVQFFSGCFRIEPWKKGRTHFRYCQIPLQPSCHPAKRFRDFRLSVCRRPWPGPQADPLCKVGIPSAPRQHHWEYAMWLFRFFSWISALLRLCLYLQLLKPKKTIVRPSVRL